MDTFKLQIIAPDGVKYEEVASAVVLPTASGHIEILPNHMPLVTLLSPGEIIIKNGGQDKSYSTEGGVVQVGNNLVKVLADTADEAHNLDELKIAEAKKAAEERLANAKDDVEYTHAAAQLEKQLAKLKYLNKRKNYR